jgi:anti-sigma28 factor (negative regulator of flagellin synthesis)
LLQQSCYEGGESTEREKIEKIKRKVEKEFPGDFALQQVHMARKLLSEEAKEKKLSFWKYISNCSLFCTVHY